MRRLGCLRKMRQRKEALDCSLLSTWVVRKRTAYFFLADFLAVVRRLAGRRAFLGLLAR